MSDSDELDLDEGGDSSSGSAPKKKGGGLGNFLPTILKFTAIGIGALIFIVTVVVITNNIMNKGGKNQTVLSEPSGPYLPNRPAYSYFDMIGSITVKTRDFPTGATVTVEVLIGYDEGDMNANAELIKRRPELQDFLRRYFSSKTAAEMAPEREEELKKEIREQLNTRFLDTARARNILFNKLDVMFDY